MNIVLISFLLNSILASNLFADGGTLFMSLILICLLLSVFFLVKGFFSLKKNPSQSKKMLRLASDASLLGLVVGFLGAFIGLITAFDSIESIGNVDPSVFAGGLKVSLLNASFGLFTFSIVRLDILILRWLQKEDLTIKKDLEKYN